LLSFFLLHPASHGRLLAPRCWLLVVLLALALALGRRPRATAPLQLLRRLELADLGLFYQPTANSQPAPGVPCSAKPGTASQLPVFGVHLAGVWSGQVLVKTSNPGADQKQKQGGGGWEVAGWPVFRWALRMSHVGAPPPPRSFPAAHGALSPGP
jgi:hypothetical protein